MQSVSESILYVNANRGTENGYEKLKATHYKEVERNIRKFNRAA